MGSQPYSDHRCSTRCAAGAHVAAALLIAGTLAVLVPDDEWAARELPELHAINPLGAPWRPHGRGAIVLPSDARSDGMFVLVLER